MERWPVLDRMAGGALLPFLAAGLAIVEWRRACAAKMKGSTSAPGSPSSGPGHAAVCEQTRDSQHFTVIAAAHYMARAFDPQRTRVYERHLMDCKTCLSHVEAMRATVNTFGLCRAIEGHSTASTAGAGSGT
jgi:hypothetical protein